MEEPNTFVKNGILSKKDSFRWSMEPAKFQKEFRTRSDFFYFDGRKFFLSAHTTKDEDQFLINLNKVGPILGIAPTNIELDPSMHQDDLSTPIKVSISMLDVRGRCHHCQERSLDADSVSVSASFGHRSYASQQDMFLRGRRLLTIECSLDVNQLVRDVHPDASQPGAINGTFPENASKKPPTSHSEERDASYSEPWRRLLDSGLHSDVAFRVGDQVLRAHKGVLAVRSPVFEAMFRHELRNGDPCLPSQISSSKASTSYPNHTVDIKDICSATMQQLLRYLYTNEIGNSLPTSELLSLYVAADKYAVLQLRKSCSALLCNSMSKEEALNIVVVAHLHEDKYLKDRAIELVLKDPVSVMRSEEWLVFLKEQSEIANDIILRMAGGIRILTE